MAFADPQSVTYAAVAKSLPRTGTSPNESIYRLSDTGGVIYTLKLSHQFANLSNKGQARQRNRAVARLEREALVSDPLATGQSVPSSMSCTFTLDFPVLLTASDAQSLGNALTGFLSSGNILKLAQGET